ncbi:DUF4266 domain-containing protein [Methylomonas sp. MO1]|jgi:hypothetical protein|uniref:DUF4266 domain-containing protein n=1 Tax=Methylomonas TaxID=416 RepID=UPI0009DAC8E4|nr:DUF4266 domain-containing protein [Methylomonas sp. MO1]MDT4291331.1 DUF4266 domain-containing protein [Methylomonas sp. MO1]
MDQLNRLFKALLMCGICALAGCAEVSPWERGNLAKRDMALNPKPNLSHFRDHIFTSKEASQGGLNGSGGGCGCN